MAASWLEEEGGGPASERRPPELPPPDPLASRGVGVIGRQREGGAGAEWGLGGGDARQAA